MITRPDAHAGLATGEAQTGKPGDKKINISLLFFLIVKRIFFSLENCEPILASTISLFLKTKYEKYI